MKNQFGQNKQRKYFQDFCPGSLLLQGYYKIESIFLQTEYRLSFCVNLEVVNFQDRNLGNIFVAILGQTNFSKGHYKIN